MFDLGSDAERFINLCKEDGRDTGGLHVKCFESVLVVDRPNYHDIICPTRIAGLPLLAVSFLFSHIPLQHTK